MAGSKHCFSSKEAECFHDISDVSTSSNASLRGVVTVSPMHKGDSTYHPCVREENLLYTPYFDGTIADDKGTLRLYGFDSNVQRKLFEAVESSEGKGVMLKHCEVKRGKHGGNFEVSCSFMLHMYVAIVATHSNTCNLFQVLISRLKKVTKILMSKQVQVENLPTYHISSESIVHRKSS